MKAVHSLLSAGLLTLTLGAQAAPQIPTIEPEGPTLAIQLDPALVRLAIVSNQLPFIGIFLISAESSLTHFLTGLPPLLADAQVLTWGFADHPRLQFTWPDTFFPPGLTMYVQGVTMSDAGIQATAVGDFVLDVTVGGGGNAVNAIH